MTKLMKNEKTLEIIDTAFSVIRSCETDCHVISALTYIGLVGREMRKMGVSTEIEIQMTLDALYTFIGVHQEIIRRNKASIERMNKYRIKHYDILKLSIL